MKKFLIGMGVMLVMATNANALTFTYEYLGTTYGTMEILQNGSNSLSVQYTASSDILAAQATGFGFIGPNSLSSIINPDDDTFSNDENGLVWVILSRINQIPNPANTNAVNKDSFIFGATAGDPSNINPPGITADETDIFYLNFAAPVLVDAITWTGVRLQSLPDTINGGSLFLAAQPAPVPEPATTLLIGLGVAGLAGIARRKKKD